MPREFEGVSATDGCTRSLGGIEAPGALVVARVSVVIVPSMSVPVCVVASVVPVCVVSRCVYTSVLKCVLQRTHRAGERRCVRGAASVSATPCVNETPCVEESPCVDETPYANETASETPSETPCVSGVVTSVPECVLPGTPCVKGAPQGGRNHVRAGGGTCVRTPLCG